MDGRVFATALKTKNIEVLEWLIAEGCQWDTITLKPQ
jgi:hypothetical protein